MDSHHFTIVYMTFFSFDGHFLCAQDVLRGIGEVRVLEERSLTGTWDIGSLQRWKWKTADHFEQSEVFGCKQENRI